MIRAGFTFEHPLTRTRTTVLETDAETNGMGWLVEIKRYSTSVPDIAEHMHRTWTERFEILQGSAKYSLDGVERIANAGESFIVEPGHYHIHPWNATKDELIYRQHNRFAKASPEAVQDILGIFATQTGLVRDRKKFKSGFKRLMQQAVTLRTVNKHGNFQKEPSILKQRLMGSTLGLLAVMLGYKAVYPQYVEE